MSKKRKGKRPARHARQRRVRAVVSAVTLAGGWEATPGASTAASRLAARVDARLREAAERVQRDIYSALPAMYPVATGTSGRGQAAAGQEAAGQEAPPCHHYLPDNRFAWWDAQANVPPTGPINRADFNVGPEAVFGCEFSPILRTMVDWEGLANGASPNARPSLQFTILRGRGSSPIVRRTDASVLSGPSQTHSVVVNELESGYMPEAPSSLRPALALFFDCPQRAVGLEYGLWSPGNPRSIPAESVVLIAYDRDGMEIIRSKGTELGPGRPDSERADYLVGVRDRNGSIIKVELFFTWYRPQDIGGPIAEPQVIYRVWHESLPACAVQQGVLESIWRGPAGPNESGELTVTLPFRCDRAVAMVRGFKLQLINSQSGLSDGLALVEVPREIEGVSFGIETSEVTAQPVGGGTTYSITLKPRGRLELADRPPELVRIYYSVLAWDSEQVELFASRYTQFGGRDPCVAHHGTSRRGTVEQACGPVFVGLQSFRAGWYGSPDGLESLFFNAGQAGRVGVAPDGGVPVEWPVVHGLEGDTFQGYQWSLEGLILSGRSLRTAPVLMDRHFVIGRVSSRLPGTFQRDHERNREDGLALSLEGIDMPFLTLGLFSFQGEGNPVSDLEVEVLGHDFNADGQALIDWKMGVGIETNLPIQGGIGSHDRHFVLGLPHGAGIVRKAAFARPRLAVQEARFEAAVDTMTLAPRRWGALQNIGDAPVLITGVTVGGLHASDFGFRLAVSAESGLLDVARFTGAPGGTFAPDEWSRFPLQLLPGETILIGGWFFPQMGGARQARIAFSTNDGNAPEVGVLVAGIVIPSEPGGQVYPPSLNFSLHLGGVELGSVRTRLLVLSSTGRTPLLLQHIMIQDPALGFAVIRPSQGGRLQLDPLDTLSIEVTFSPVALGQVSTDLVLYTNAGNFRASLLARGEPTTKPDGTLVPGGLIFGAILIGAARTKPAFIESTGTRPLAIESISIESTNKGFSATPLGMVTMLPPLGRLRIDVTFAPGDPGEARNRLLVQTDAGVFATTLFGVGRAS